jgi:hypothetical protein
MTADGQASVLDVVVALIFIDFKAERIYPNRCQRSLNYFDSSGYASQIIFKGLCFNAARMIQDSSGYASASVDRIVQSFCKMQLVVICSHDTKCLGGAAMKLNWVF